MESECIDHLDEAETHRIQKCQTPLEALRSAPPNRWSRRLRIRERGVHRGITAMQSLLLMVLVFTQTSIIAFSYHYEYPTTMSSRRKLGHDCKRKDFLYLRKSSSAVFGVRLLAVRDDEESPETSDNLTKFEKELMKRVTRLEALVSKQEIEIHRLKTTADKLVETTEAFARVIQLLQEAGLRSDGYAEEAKRTSDEIENRAKAGSAVEERQAPNRVVESFDDSMIFGTAPASVSDAADGAGAAILAAMLGGKQRMIVDVRDAELSSDPETLVQFLELTILPIAAGLEGLESMRNRVKIVFPKVSQLLEYRRTMALAAPEVVTLSTLGFDPVEKRDKLVVIVAPEPDDEEGLKALNELLFPTATSEPIQQPVVLVNYHMVPVAGLPIDFETAYHLRLLSVQYMSEGNAPDFFQQFKGEREERMSEPKEEFSDTVGTGNMEDNEDEVEIEDQALEAAMKHAHESGMNQGVTRAMVIRAYPKPWHVFVDTSPDTDADFEVAATFDQEPTLDELNSAIVECLEGSEREDEIVAQQMQQALEEGQLERVSDMIEEALMDRYDEDGDDDDEEINIEDSDRRKE